MDTSFWIQCNPKITVEHTTKKFYDRYLYKIVVYCPAGRLIDSKGDMQEALEHRKSVYKHITKSSWWGARQNKDLDKADLSLLENLRSIRINKSLGFKLRVEEPRVQIYSNSEEELKDLIDNYLTGYLTNIDSVSGPASAECASVLNAGAIIRKTNNGYSHKIILRDGRYAASVKETILQYLQGLQIENVGIPKSCQKSFSKSTGYVWNCYFYTNDPSVTTFLNLIQPGIVSNIHELVVAD